MPMNSHYRPHISPSQALYRRTMLYFPVWHDGFAVRPYFYWWYNAALVPTGAMQFPIYDYDSPTVYNYGALGTRLSNSMVHSIDRIGELGWCAVLLITVSRLFLQGMLLGLPSWPGFLIRPLQLIWRLCTRRFHLQRLDWTTCYLESIPSNGCQTPRLINSRSLALPRYLSSFYRPPWLMLPDQPSQNY